MAGNKTIETTASVTDFIAAVEPEQRRADAERLLQLFGEVTGYAPRMWGPSIIGFGSYHYRYESGRDGTWLATGFSPRKAELSVYIMPGYSDYGDLLERLGKHKLGKSCLYIKRLDDIDEAVLKRLIRRGLDDLNKKWPVSAS